MRGGILCRPRTAGAAALLRHPPEGHQPHRPRPHRAVRQLAGSAVRSGGGADGGALHQGKGGGAGPAGPRSVSAGADVGGGLRGHPGHPGADRGILPAALHRPCLRGHVPALPGRKGQKEGAVQAG